MLRFMGRILAAGLFLVAGASHAQVVVSQVYGGGGNTGAPFNRDFVELFNRGSSPVALGGMSVQYASATGTGNFAIGATLPSATLAPGQYFLVGMSSGANGAALPTIDASGNSSMSGTAGKVVLVNSASSLACNGGSTPCSAAQLALILDLVGYGSANFFEGAPTASLSNTTGALRRENGCTDTGNNSADFVVAAPTPRNSASPLSVCGATQPVLGINDVSVFEGDVGTTTATFTVNLSIPAGAGGVVFDIATADGTAAASSDYVAKALVGQTIAAGSSSASFSVTVSGDTTVEANETFFVNIANATGATVGDAQGIGTIQNDDVNVVAIPEIQGSGAISPMTGQIVTTEGIVTARKFNNGFFLQSANDDGNPATSEGIFVFTSSAPPATATVGNRVRVSGTVTEFTPSTNLNQLSITELVSVTSIQVISTDNPLPAPVELTSADFGAGTTPVTAEKYEGMRVSVGTAKAVSGSDGNIDENDALSTTTGVFHVVLPDVARPFREAGIGILDAFPIPASKNPPRFDTNQERLMVRSRGQIGASALAVDVDAEVGNLVGVLDYFSGTWALLPDAGTTISVAGGKQPTAVSDARYEDVTIGAFNLLRFFDEINDSNGAVTMTAAALDKRLTKTGSAICDYLKTPDILGVVEVENLRVLDLLAQRIRANCPGAPFYLSHLVQGNDVGGINVGFLVNNNPAGYSDRHRVQVLEVTQYGKDTVFTNPNGTTSLLNDRPPLLLRALIHQDNGASYPVTVIINHLRSLNGIDETTPGSSGWATESERVRAKRAQQAQFLANLVHQRQLANPGERIVLLGDFNAFEFSDGYVDVMGIVRGDEAAEGEVLTYADSPITTPLIDGSQLILDPAERYSYVFEGSAQTLDHVVVNEAVLMDALDVAVDHARINADFGVHHYGETGNALRVSDHDPVRIAISVPGFRSADLSLTYVPDPDGYPPVRVGEPTSFVMTAANAGPNDAPFAAVAFVFGSLVSPTIDAPSGWICGAPTQEDNRTYVTCTTPLFAVGQTSPFTVTFIPGLELAGNSVWVEAAITSQIADTANANNNASLVVNVFSETDISVTWSGGPTVPFRSGTTSNLTMTVANAGPDGVLKPYVFLWGDIPVSNVVITAPSGWTCVSNYEFQFYCESSVDLMADQSASFDFAITAPPRDDDGITINAFVDSSANSTDPQENDLDTYHVDIIGAPRETPADPKPAPTPPGRNH